MLYDFDADVFVCLMVVSWLIVLDCYFVICMIWLLFGV